MAIPGVKRPALSVVAIVSGLLTVLFGASVVVS
jgi:hypothetical protein